MKSIIVEHLQHNRHSPQDKSITSAPLLNNLILNSGLPKSIKPVCPQQKLFFYDLFFLLPIATKFTNITIVRMIFATLTKPTKRIFKNQIWCNLFYHWMTRHMIYHEMDNATSAIKIGNGYIQFLAVLVCESFSAIGLRYAYYDESFVWNLTRKLRLVVDIFRKYRTFVLNCSLGVSPRIVIAIKRGLWLNKIYDISRLLFDEKVKIGWRYLSRLGNQAYHLLFLSE